MVSKEISLSLGKNTCSSKYSLGEKWSPIVPYSILFKNFYWSRVAFNPVLLSVCVCVCVCVCAQLLSCVWLFATPWNVALQAPLFTRFSRQENWSGLPFCPPGDLPNPGIKPESPVLTGVFFHCHLGIPVLVSAVKQSESVICIHISTLFLIPFSFQSPQRNQ